MSTNNAVGSQSIILDSSNIKKNYREVSQLITQLLIHQLGFDISILTRILELYEYAVYLEFVKKHETGLMFVPSKHVNAHMCLVAYKHHAGALRSISQFAWNESLVKELVSELGFIDCIPSIFATREIYELTAMKNPVNIYTIPFDSIDQELCDKVFDYDKESLYFIPDEYRTQKMYDIGFCEMQMDIMTIPEDFISEKIAQTCAARYGVLNYLPVAAISPLVRKIYFYCNPSDAPHFGKKFLDTKVIEMIICSGVDLIGMHEHFELTEKNAMILIVCAGVHQKDLPRAFHTSYFALQLAKKYIFKEDLLIPQCIDDDVRRELYKNTSGKIIRSEIVSYSCTREFADYYFEGTGLSKEIIDTAYKTRTRRRR